jgi:hypothetical protein
MMAFTIKYVFIYHVMKIDHNPKQGVQGRTQKAYLPTADLQSYKYCVVSILFRQRKK